MVVFHLLQLPRAVKVQIYNWICYLNLPLHLYNTKHSRNLFFDIFGIFFYTPTWWDLEGPSPELKKYIILNLTIYLHFPRASVCHYTLRALWGYSVCAAGLECVQNEVRLAEPWSWVECTNTHSILHTFQNTHFWRVHNEYLSIKLPIFTWTLYLL